MPRPARRYLLLAYTHILNRWSRIVFTIGLVLLALAGGFYLMPRLAPQAPVTDVSSFTVSLLAGMGGFSVLLALFLFTIRKFAYVQAHENHLRLVTPFLRMKISYRRIRQTSCVAMTSLFPLNKAPRRRRALMRNLMKHTAVVLDLNGLPLPRSTLRLFLSPLFFPDRSARLALLVPDWMKFSTELESLRSAWVDAQNQPDRDPRMALLSSIQKSKK